jgi:competence protein ComEC
MKNILIVLAGLLLFFGCIDLGGEIQPPQNLSNGTTPPAINTTTTPTQNVSIIIGPQQNVSITTNQTEQNQTPVEPVTPGMNYSVQTNAPLVVYFIPVGQTWPESLQGEAIYIKKGDIDILIDAGPMETVSRIENRLRNANADDIDLIISTAADKRRYGGIPNLLERFKVEEFWWTGNDFGNTSYKNVIEKINEKNVYTRIIVNGFSTTMNGIKIEVLNPRTLTFSDVNNDAAVIRIDDREFSMFITSNIQTGAREAIVSEQKNRIKNVTVLVAPYYGLGVGTSGIQLFLSEMNPKQVIICGNSDDSQTQGGSRDAFKNLMNGKKIPYTENYVNGTVAVNSNGYIYSVQYIP